MIYIRLANFGNPDIADGIGTTVQAETYRTLHKFLTRNSRVTIQQIMDDLKIEKMKTFFSRLDHLQQKGLIEYSR